MQLQIFSKLGSRLLGSKNYLRGAKTVKIDLCTTEHNSVKFACSLFVSVFASMSRACYYHHISIHCYPLLRYDLSTNNECVNVNQNTSKGFLEVWNKRAKVSWTTAHGQNVKETKNTFDCCISSFKRILADEYFTRACSLRSGSLLAK